MSAAAKETEWQRRKRRERERDAYIAVHGNVCELCGNQPKSRGLSEDHDHKTGEHRGWVCYRCNRLMPSYLDASLAYRLYVYLVRAEHRERDAKKREEVLARLREERTTCRWEWHRGDNVYYACELPQDHDGPHVACYLREQPRSGEGEWMEPAA